jgi:uncharacterized protein YkwD
VREPYSRTLPLLGLVVIIPALALLCLLLVRETVERRSVTPAPLKQRQPLSEDPRLSVKGIIEFTNKVRAENGGLPPLSENSLLDAIASERAEDMLRKQYFAHVSPSGEGAADIAQKTGYHYKHLGENIAMGLFQTDEKVVMGWMQSPSHRKNILSDGCSEIGAAAKRGTMKGEEVWVAVQIFGEQSLPLPTEPSTQPPITYASASPGDRARGACAPPEESLLEAITKVKAELADLTEQATSLHKEISADKSDGVSNVEVRQWNQKILKYNELVNATISTRRTLERLISDYNQSIQSYNDCMKN